MSSSKLPPGEPPRLFDDVWQTQDSVHGLIAIPGILKQVIDTEIFQRMRHIKQTGMCEFLYIGATHTRFAHSIGVCYLGFILMEKIRRKHPGKASRKDVLCICMAALCHDLGHPMFSHMFEDFMRMNGCPNWSHEDASLKLVDELFEQLDVSTWGSRMEAKKDREDTEVYTDFDLNEQDQQFIRELIHPPDELQEYFEKGTLHEEWDKMMTGRGFEDVWMYEVVSNWRSGLDVDRIDYFLRDSQHFFGHLKDHMMNPASTTHYNIPHPSKSKPGFDYSRYFSNVLLDFHLYDAKPAKDGQPCVPGKTKCWTLALPSKDFDGTKSRFFGLRQELHETAYQHKTVKKLETHMLQMLTHLRDHMRVRDPVSLEWNHGEEVDMAGEPAGPDRTVSIMEAADLKNFRPELYVQLTDDLLWRTLKESNLRTVQYTSAAYTCNILDRNLMRQAAKFSLPYSMEADQQDGLLEYIAKYVMRSDVAERLPLGPRSRGGSTALSSPTSSPTSAGNALSTAPPILKFEDVMPKKKKSKNPADSAKGRLFFTTASVHQGSKEEDPTRNILVVNKKVEGKERKKLGEERKFGHKCSKKTRSKNHQGSLHDDSLMVHLDEGLPRDYTEEEVKLIHKIVQKEKHCKRISYIFWDVPLECDVDAMRRRSSSQSRRPNQLILRPKFTREEQHVIMMRMSEGFEEFMNATERDIDMLKANTHITHARHLAGSPGSRLRNLRAVGTGEGSVGEVSGGVSGGPASGMAVTQVVQGVIQTSESSASDPELSRAERGVTAENRNTSSASAVGQAGNTSNSGVIGGPGENNFAGESRKRTKSGGVRKRVLKAQSSAVGPPSSALLGFKPAGRNANAAGSSSHGGNQTQKGQDAMTSGPEPSASTTAESSATPEDTNVQTSKNANTTNNGKTNPNNSNENGPTDAIMVEATHRNAPPSNCASPSGPGLGGVRDSVSPGLGCLPHQRDARDSRALLKRHSTTDESKREPERNEHTLRWALGIVKKDAVASHKEGYTGLNMTEAVRLQRAEVAASASDVGAMMTGTRGMRGNEQLNRNSNVRNHSSTTGLTPSKNNSAKTSHTSLDDETEQNFVTGGSAAKRRKTDHSSNSPSPVPEGIVPSSSSAAEWDLLSASGESAPGMVPAGFTLADMPRDATLRRRRTHSPDNEQPHGGNVNEGATSSAKPNPQLQLSPFRPNNRRQRSSENVNNGANANNEANSNTPRVSVASSEDTAFAGSPKSSEGGSPLKPMKEGEHKAAPVIDSEDCGEEYGMRYGEKSNEVSGTADSDGGKSDRGTAKTKRFQEEPNRNLREEAVRSALLFGGRPIATPGARLFERQAEPYPKPVHLDAKANIQNEGGEEVAPADIHVHKNQVDGDLHGSCDADSDEENSAEFVEENPQDTADALHRSGNGWAASAEGKGGNGGGKR